MNLFLWCTELCGPLLSLPHPIELHSTLLSYSEQLEIMYDTILDHHRLIYLDNTFPTAILQPAQSNHMLQMKDFIIRSDEFLFRTLDEIQEQATLTSCLNQPPPNEENYPLEGNPQNGPLDENRDYHNIATGGTPLHSFNTFIKNLHFHYDKTLIRKENVNDLKIRNISNEIRNFKKEVENNRDPQAKIEVNKRRKKIQRSWTMKTEGREEAPQRSITTRMGKNEP